MLKEMWVICTKIEDKSIEGEQFDHKPSKEEIEKVMKENNCDRVRVKKMYLMEKDLAKVLINDKEIYTGDLPDCYKYCENQWKIQEDEWESIPNGDVRIDYLNSGVIISIIQNREE